jgi:cell division septum initiation protein DivIVA
MDAQYDGIIAELRDELTGKKGFFGKKTDNDRCLALLDMMIGALPQEIRDARRIIDERDALLSSARAESAQMLDEAERRASFTVSESETVRLADEEAQRISEEARSEADALVRDAREYAGRVMDDLERSLLKYLSIVRGDVDNTRPDAEK